MPARTGRWVCSGTNEGVEAALFGRAGQLGWGHGPIGQERGDADAHRSGSAAGGELRAEIGAGIGERAWRTPPSSGPGPPRRQDRRAAVINCLIRRVASGRNEAMRRARVSVSSSTVPTGHTRRASPASTASAAPIRTPRPTAAPPPVANPCARATASCWRPRAGHRARRRRTAQAAAFLHQHQVDVTEQGAAEPDRRPVNRGQQRLVEGDQGIEQAGGPATPGPVRQWPRWPERPSRGDPGPR